MIAFKNTALIGIGIAAVAGMGRFLVEFGEYDPFAALHRNRDEPEPREAIQLKGVTMKHYKGAKLTTQADVGEVSIRRDRRFFDLKGITNGVYESEKGPYKFAASAGTWDQYRGLLTMNEKVRVANKDFDVQTSVATFDNETKTVEMPKPIAGRFLDGQIKAASGTYVLNASNDIVVKQVAWTGKAALALQEDDPTPKKWTLQGDLVTSSGDIMTYTNGEGTDGDIIVKGQKIEHNRKTDVVTVTGKVEYYSGAANMTSDKAVVFRKEKRAVLTGSVVMLIKPKSERDKPPKVEEIRPFVPQLPDSVKAGPPRAARSDKDKQANEDLRDPKNIRKYPMVVRADDIEYFYRKGQRKANINGSPQAKQDLPDQRWRQVWATKGFWEGEKELLTLSSASGKVDVRMKNSIGDDLIAMSFTLSTKEEDESFTGQKVSGDVWNDDPDEEMSTGTKREANTKPPADPPVKDPEKKDPEKGPEKKETDGDKTAPPPPTT